MSKNPLVSILVAAFNHEKFVQASLQSIIDQNYQNIELWILDDCSVDNTAGKIREMVSVCKERFTNFNFSCHKKNHGVTFTLNEMLPKLNGKYVCFFASDDVMEKDRISIQVKTFEQLNKSSSKVAMVWSNAQPIDATGKKTFFRPLKTDQYMVAPKLALSTNDLSSQENYFLLLNKNQFYPAPTMMWRANVFKQIGKFDENVGLEDFDVLLRFFRAKQKAFYIDEKLIRYRWHGANTVVKYRDKSVADLFYLYERERQYCVKNNLLSQWQPAYKNFLWGLARRDLLLRFVWLWQRGFGVFVIKKLLHFPIDS